VGGETNRKEGKGTRKEKITSKENGSRFRNWDHKTFMSIEHL